jgi:hypothetical protein
MYDSCELLVNRRWPSSYAIPPATQTAAAAATGISRRDQDGFRPALRMVFRIRASKYGGTASLRIARFICSVTRNPSSSCFK